MHCLVCGQNVGFTITLPTDWQHSVVWSLVAANRYNSVCKYLRLCVCVRRVLNFSKHCLAISSFCLVKWHKTPEIERNFKSFSKFFSVNSLLQQQKYIRTYVHIDIHARSHMKVCICMYLYMPIIHFCRKFSICLYNTIALLFQKYFSMDWQNVLTDKSKL